MYLCACVCLRMSVESRPLSIPMKITQSATECTAFSEEWIKNLITQAWDAVKRLTLQVHNYWALSYLQCYIIVYNSQFIQYFILLPIIPIIYMIWYEPYMQIYTTLKKTAHLTLLKLLTKQFSHLKVEILLFASLTNILCTVFCDQ